MKPFEIPHGFILSFLNHLLAISGRMLEKIEEEFLDLFHAGFYTSNGMATVSSYRIVAEVPEDP